MAKFNTFLIAAGVACLLAGCSAAPEKMLETSSIAARKKPRVAGAADEVAVSKSPLAQACAQRHVDYQAGRNQPQTLEQKQAMDTACASAH